MTENFKRNFVEAFQGANPKTMEDYWEALKKKKFCCWVKVIVSGEVVFDDRVRKNEWGKKKLTEEVLIMVPKRIIADATLKSRNKLCFVIE